MTEFEKLFEPEVQEAIMMERTLQKRDPHCRR